MTEIITQAKEKIKNLCSTLVRKAARIKLKKRKKNERNYNIKRIS